MHVLDFEAILLKASKALRTRAARFRAAANGVRETMVEQGITTDETDRVVLEARDLLGRAERLTAEANLLQQACKERRRPAIQPDPTRSMNGHAYFARMLTASKLSVDVLEEISRQAETADAHNSSEASKDVEALGFCADKARADKARILELEAEVATLRAAPKARKKGGVSAAVAA